MKKLFMLILLPSMIQCMQSAPKICQRDEKLSCIEHFRKRLAFGEGFSMAWAYYDICTYPHFSGTIISHFVVPGWEKLGLEELLIIYTIKEIVEKVKRLDYNSQFEISAVNITDEFSIVFKKLGFNNELVFVNAAKDMKKLEEIQQEIEPRIHAQAHNFE